MPRLKRFKPDGGPWPVVAIPFPTGKKQYLTKPVHYRGLYGYASGDTFVVIDYDTLVPESWIDRINSVSEDFARDEYIVTTPWVFIPGPEEFPSLVEKILFPGGKALIRVNPDVPQPFCRNKDLYHYD